MTSKKDSDFEQTVIQSLSDIKVSIGVLETEVKNIKENQANQNLSIKEALDKGNSNAEKTNLLNQVIDSLTEEVEKIPKIEEKANEQYIWIKSSYRVLATVGAVILFAITILGFIIKFIKF